MTATTVQSHQRERLARLSSRRKKRMRKRLDDARSERRQRASLLANDPKAMRMCGSKRKYATESEATIMAMLQSTPMTPLHVYKCPLCDGWHMTHRT